MKSSVRRTPSCALAVLLLSVAGPASAAEPPATAAPAIPAPASGLSPAILERATTGLPITVQKCGGSARVQGRRGGASIDVTYAVDGAKTADGVEFLMRNESGPRYALAVRDNGNFAPGAVIHHVLSGDAPSDIGPFLSYPNHCSVTLVHYTDGTQVRALGTFAVADRPEILAEFGLAPKSGPRGVAVASDGSLWVTEETANAIAHVDSGNGKVLGEFPIPTARADVRFIARGAGDTMWFDEYRSAKIGTIAADGTIREFPVGCTGCHPGPLVVDQAGNAWFAEWNFEFDPTRPQTLPRFGAQVIGKITRDGVVSEYPVPTKVSFLNSLVAVRDGTLWFTESGGKIGHMAADGTVIVELGPAGPTTRPWWIGQDGAGALRVLSTNAQETIIGLGTVDRTAGGGYAVTTKYSSLSGRTVPSGGAFDRQGNVWFTDFSGNRIARAGDDGRTAEVNLGAGGGTMGVVPTSITAADDGTLWVVELVANRLVHIRPR